MTPAIPSRRIAALLGCVFLLASLAPTAAGAAPAPSPARVEAHPAAAVSCAVARRLVTGARQSVARAQRALRAARTTAARRRARARLRTAERALAAARRRQAAACRLVNHPPAFPSPLWADVATSFQYDATTRELAAAQTTIRLLAAARDRDGDRLTYTWSASSGTIVGDGLRATWRRSIQGGRLVAGTVTVRASDGRGGVAVQTLSFTGGID